MTIAVLVAGALVLAFFNSCSKRQKTSTLQTLAEERLAVAADAEREAASLAAEFDAEKDEARQVELIYQMGSNGCPAAQQSLARIYHSTTDAQLKIDVVEALGFVENEDRGTSLSVLQDAASDGRPEELRDAAIGTLRDLNSPATLPVWKILLNDSSPERRESARAAIEYYATFEQ